MIGSLDLQVVKGSLMMSCGALQVTDLVLHTKEVAGNFRLAANEGAFRRTPLRTFRLAFGLHAQTKIRARPRGSHWQRHSRRQPHTKETALGS